MSTGRKNGIGWRKVLTLDLTEEEMEVKVKEKNKEQDRPVQFLAGY